VDLSQHEFDVEDLGVDLMWGLTGVSNNLDANTVITGKQLTIVPNTTAVPSTLEYVDVRLTDLDGDFVTQRIGVTIAAGHAPDITTTSLPGGRVGHLYQQTIQVTDADLPNDQLTFTYKLTPSSTSFNLDPQSGVITWTPSAHGTYTLEVNVTDLGNLKDTEVFNIQITSANDPEFDPALTPKTHYLNAGTYERVIGANDADNDPVTISLLSGPKDMTFLAASNTVQWSANDIQTAGPGQYPVTLQLNDGTGNIIQDSYTLTIYDNNQAPIFTSTPDTETYVSDTYNYDADALDPNTDPLTYSLLQAPTGMQISSTTGLITWTPTANDVGAHIVTVEVTDGNYPVTQQYTLTVYHGQHTPLITSQPVTTATEGVLYTYDVEAIDPDADTLTYSLLQAPTGIQINQNTGVITWTPTQNDAQQSPHTVRVQVSDGANTNVQEYQLTVYYDDPVSFTINADKLSGEGPLTVSFTVDMHSANPATGYEWDFGDGLKSTLASPSHTFTEPGRYTVTAKVTDIIQQTSTGTIVITVEEEHKDQPRDKVHLNKVAILNREVLAGDFANLKLKFTNNDNYDIENVKVTAVIQDFSSRMSVGPFDVDSGDSVTKNLYLDVPYDALPGEYPVKITISESGKPLRTKYRFITVLG